MMPFFSSLALHCGYYIYNIYICDNQIHSDRAFRFRFSLYSMVYTSTGALCWAKIIWSSISNLLTYYRNQQYNNRDSAHMRNMEKSISLKVCHGCSQYKVSGPDKKSKISNS